MVLIGARASNAKETNQAPPWLRYTGDQRDACKDLGPAEPQVVWPHHGCTRTPSSSLWPDFLSRCVRMHDDPRDAGVRFLFSGISE